MTLIHHNVSAQFPALFTERRMKESVSTKETVDTMTLDILKGSGGLRAVKVLSNGKRRFDPVEKDRLIDAAMKLGYRSPVWHWRTASTPISYATG